MFKNLIVASSRGTTSKRRSRVLLSVFFVALLYLSKTGTFVEVLQGQTRTARLIPKVGTRLGQLAPDFTLADTQGRVLRLSAMRGRNVILVFWSFGCPHCAARIPLLNKVNAGGLKVVAVAPGATAAQARQYAADRNVRFELLADADGTVGRAYSVTAVPQPFWIDTDGTILLNGSEHASLIWTYLADEGIQAEDDSGLQAYVVPYVGDIDGGVDEGWFAFYERLLQWHEDNAMPGSFSFYPETMNDIQFNEILGEMHASDNVELILKGEDTYQGRRIDLMTYAEAKQALRAWQNKFILALEQVGYSDVQPPVAYNQLLQRFNNTVRDAAHDVGYEIYLEQGVSDEYGYVEMLPDFDITQYSVALTTTGLPGPETVYKSPEELIEDILTFDDEGIIFINGVKVVPLLCHQQDFRVAEDSDEVNEGKFAVYTTLLTMARDDPRIKLIKPHEVYELRHGSPLNFILTDFESDDHGWVADGVGQGRFEIGPPVSFDPEEGECLTECFGTGPEEDHSPLGVNAACTNLDGHMAPLENEFTNSLTSPVYDFTGRRDVGLQLWAFMEIEGLTYDSCYFQYKNDPMGDWVTFESFGDDAEDSDTWFSYAKNLSAVADGRSYFQLRFFCTTDGYFEGSGLCLDDIRLSWSKAADLDGNNEIDFRDYASLVDAWMTSSADSAGRDRYDLSRDGIVDMADLAELANDWLSAGYSSLPLMRTIDDATVHVCDWQGCAAGAASVSIDDSYTSCRDILNENGFRGTYYLSWTDTFSDVEWDIWRAMYAEGHELGGHTITHGSGDFLEEETLHWELSTNKNDILSNVGMPETELTSFAWPRGDATREAEAIASEYYISARGYHMNKLEEKNPADFMYLKSLNTPHYHDPEDDPPDYFEMADEAEARGKWVNFVFHNECLDDGAIHYLTTKDLWVAPVGRVAKYIKERQNARIVDITRTPSELDCTLTCDLDPQLFNQKLTVRITVDPAEVQTVFVNGKAAVFTKDISYILVNVRPSGNDKIRVIFR